VILNGDCQIWFDLLQAWLAEHGLACPNIFTGGYNFHSKHELISLQSMKSAVEVIVNITNLALNK
ncbi:hypothetical protein GVX86_06110, partial [[Haemophilus] felis]|nr:hypothetical protein [[Haemophilus] felis]